MKDIETLPEIQTSTCTMMIDYRGYIHFDEHIKFRKFMNNKFNK